jgi:hypothetical protein
MPDDQRRVAERIELQNPIEATLVDFPARVVEISLVNCKLEHADKVPMGSNVMLQFEWSGEKIRLKGKLLRSEMRPAKGKMMYVSAMEFAQKLEDAPPPLRRLLASLVSWSSPAAEEEIEEIESSAEIPAYVRCTWVDEEWVPLRTNDPKQPLLGFTMMAPDTDQEIDDFCKTYTMADPETQRMIRLSFELAIADHRRKNKME